MGKRKLTLEQMQALVADAAATQGENWQALAPKYGIAVSTVYHILTRHSWYTVPRVWVMPETPIKRGAARWKRNSKKKGAQSGD